MKDSTKGILFTCAMLIALIVLVIGVNFVKWYWDYSIKKAAVRDAMIESKEAENKP